ncbi:hypothetical protein J6590_000888 [Homalodisca vitripennis]|nr:hypothetical protein J6590_000888 [Homalodisca vitripennis]
MRTQSSYKALSSAYRLHQQGYLHTRILVSEGFQIRPKEGNSLALSTLPMDPRLSIKFTYCSPIRVGINLPPNKKRNGKRSTTIGRTLLKQLPEAFVLHWKRPSTYNMLCK